MRLAKAMNFTEYSKTGSNMRQHDAGRRREGNGSGQGIQRFGDWYTGTEADLERDLAELAAHREASRAGSGRAGRQLPCAPFSDHEPGQVIHLTGPVPWQAHCSNQQPHCTSIVPPHTMYLASVLMNSQRRVRVPAVQSSGTSEQCRR